MVMKCLVCVGQGAARVSTMATGHWTGREDSSGVGGRRTLQQDHSAHQHRQDT